MKNKVIAVVSSDEKFFRFFELECGVWGFKTERKKELIEYTDRYVLIIVDKDTVPETAASIDCLRINFSVKNTQSEIDFDEKLYSQDLCWPVSVKTIGALMEKLYFGDMPQKAASAVLKEDRIFYSTSEDGVVWYKNKKICLSTSEMKVLKCLCSANGEPVSREKLNGLFDTGRGNIGDVYICHLRKKLEEPFSCKLIYTVRGKGYRISAELKKM